MGGAAGHRHASQLRSLHRGGRVHAQRVVLGDGDLLPRGLGRAGGSVRRGAVRLHQRRFWPQDVRLHQLHGRHVRCAEAGADAATDASPNAQADAATHQAADASTDTAANGPANAAPYCSSDATAGAAAPYDAAHAATDGPTDARAGQCVHRHLDEASR